jgi:hypothetical protein
VALDHLWGEMARFLLEYSVLVLNEISRLSHTRREANDYIRATQSRHLLFVVVGHYEHNRH